MNLKKWGASNESLTPVNGSFTFYQEKSKMSLFEYMCTDKRYSNLRLQHSQKEEEINPQQKFYRAQKSVKLPWGKDWDFTANNHALQVASNQQTGSMILSNLPKTGAITTQIASTQTEWDILVESSPHCVRIKPLSFISKCRNYLYIGFIHIPTSNIISCKLFLWPTTCPT